MIAVLANIAIIDSMRFVSYLSISFGYINFGNLLANVPRFEADCLASLVIYLFLLFNKSFNQWSTGCRGVPAGQFLITDLSIGMAQTMQFRETGPYGFRLLDAKLVPVVAIARYQRPANSEPVRTVQDLALVGRAPGGLSVPFRPWSSSPSVAGGRLGRRSSGKT